MTAMNVVHMRVKPGSEEAFVKAHREMDPRKMPGGRNFRIVKAGERDFIVVAEWESMAALAAARPAMIANLDGIRPLLEDLGGGRGLTEPWSGEVVVSL
ncbi:MAG: antibiotic biosynthesis monooxygenase [Rhodobacteraceae bacterium]|nr:antibiotic biosynthesis monooxygenase [Paracoccaceae bacterium]